MKKVGIAFAIIGVVAVFILLVVFGSHWVYVQKAVNMPGEVAERVLNADDAIANYEWFKKQEAFIRQCLKDEEITKRQYDEYFAKLPEDIKEWTDFMNKEESTLRAAYNAHEKLTNKAIEDYNAKASMVNRSIFKDLPTNILRSAEDSFILILGND